ncbi:MAG: hypothetical protein EXS55_04690 [Candidatus Magasanikbacteria bacterium]|nr:hypothetical protein [Candidatus Magasanikbacteria bacterium]
MSEKRTPPGIEIVSRDFHPRESIAEHIFRLQQEIGLVVAELCRHEKWWKKVLSFLETPPLPTAMLAGMFRELANFEGVMLKALFGTKHKRLESFDVNRRHRIQELTVELVTSLSEYHKLLEKIPAGDRDGFLQQLKQSVAQHDKKAAKIFEKIISANEK